MAWQCSFCKGDTLVWYACMKSECPKRVKPEYRVGNYYDPREIEKRENMNLSLMNKDRATLNTCLDILSQFRFTIDTVGLVPQSINITYEQLYALVYHEMKRIDADMENRNV